jgi:hypothetical protein
MAVSIYLYAVPAFADRDDVKLTDPTKQAGPTFDAIAGVRVSTSATLSSGTPIAATAGIVFAAAAALTAPVSFFAQATIAFSTVANIGRAPTLLAATPTVRLGALATLGGGKPPDVPIQTYALAQIARSGATRSNFTSSHLFASIGGVQLACARTGAGWILADTLSIGDDLNEAANTATFTVYGAAVQYGNEIILTIGSINNGRREFAGWILNVRQRYIGTPRFCVYDVNAIDYTWGLSRREVSDRFIGATIGTIVQQLVATYAAGYTVWIDPSIGSLTIDDISYTAQPLADCLTQTVKRKGLHWLCDDHKVVRVFETDTWRTPPRPLTPTDTMLLRFEAQYDLSQVVTRALSEGGGGSALTGVVAGETILPLDTAIWYEAAGLIAVNTQRIKYTGVDPGRTGSLVGIGAAPLNAVQLATAPGGNVPAGTHAYAFTFVTAAGESLPSPIASIGVQYLSAPTQAPINTSTTVGGNIPNGTHQYAVSFITAAGESLVGPLSNPYTITNVVAPTSFSVSQGGSLSGSSFSPGTYRMGCTFVYNDGTESNLSPTVDVTLDGNHYVVYDLPTGPTGLNGVTVRKIYWDYGRDGHYETRYTIPDNTTTHYEWSPTSSLPADSGHQPPNIAVVATHNLTNIAIGPAGVTARRLYRQHNGVFGLRLVTEISNNTWTTWIDTSPDYSLGVSPPSTPTATANTVLVSGVGVGAGSVTARKIYRSAANQAQLKLLTTLADNVTSSWTDVAADAALGANVPTADTSGLQQGQGTVAAGANVIPVASATWARTLGGWAVIGNGQQVVRYTGITGNALTGIPATGPGAITAAIAYNSSITGAAQLTGIPSSGAGSIVQTIARGDPVNLLVIEDDVTAQAALKAVVQDPSFDGVQEDYLADNRLSASEARTRARAWLDLRKDVAVTIHATTRDLNTRSGATIEVSLDSFGIFGRDFLIQHVTESSFQLALMPTFDFDASSVRFTFDDYLRMLKAAQE